MMCVSQVVEYCLSNNSIFDNCNCMQCIVYDDVTPKGGPQRCNYSCPLAGIVIYGLTLV